MKHITGRSPLTYPGAKTQIRQDVVGILKCFGAEYLGLCSPFMGGGAIELHAAMQNIEVNASDAFQPLVEFWHVLQERPQELSSLVYAKLKTAGYRCFYGGEHDPDAKRRLGYIPKLYFLAETPLERAAYFYIRNKTSFSGMMFKDCDFASLRFDDYAVIRRDGRRSISIDSLTRLRDFYSPITIRCLDYRIALAGHPYQVVYCDPPYVDAEKLLYGIGGSMQKGFCHKTFFKHITSRKSDWVLSYDNHPMIRELYKDYFITTRNWAYGMTKDRKSKEPRELIICSRDPIAA